MPVPSDEYLNQLAYKLSQIEQEISGVISDIGFYLTTDFRTMAEHRLIESLQHMRDIMTNDWPVYQEGEPMQEPSTSRFNCGPHAVLITPGAINGPPPFKVVVWLNADKGNTSHNKKFVEIKPKREFKTREAAYMYGSHLCRRTNEREA